MIKQRRIDDADLMEIAGGGELVISQQKLKQSVPSPPVGGDAVAPDTDDQANGDQTFGL
jgi:hypothetical protein